MNHSFGLYIHVPFCLSKCPYCDFYSAVYDSGSAESYIDAVCRAIKNSGYRGRAVDTVYFGGGTPVLLGEKGLSRILETAAGYFDFTEPEITLEANPAAALPLAGLKSAGFNRVSFGVQSGLDNELRELGRIHDAGCARASIIAAARAGFTNISADLMIGIPYQTRESLVESIDFLTALPLSHISAYMLKIEENTPFASRDFSGFRFDEDSVAELYLQCVGALAERGFTQYEISNFAKDGFESRHNLKYWNCQEYLGIGPSAHSYMDGERFYCPKDLNSFIRAENPASLTVVDGRGGSFEEYAMLRLRLNKGLNLHDVSSVFGVDVTRLAEKARALERNRLVTSKGGVIALTPRGFLLSNAVTAHLLY